MKKLLLALGLILTASVSHAFYTVVLNGQSYLIPAKGDTGYSSGVNSLDAFLQAIPGGLIQTSGGQTITGPLTIQGLSTFGTVIASSATIPILYTSNLHFADGTVQTSTSTFQAAGSYAGLTSTETFSAAQTFTSSVTLSGPVVWNGQTVSTTTWQTAGSYQPAGNYLTSTNSLVAGTTFYVSSGTVQGQLTVSTMTANQVTTSSITVNNYAYTSWTAYTPTIVGVGTPSYNQAFWKQVGDTIFVHGFFVSGTATAVPLTVSLPNSTAINTSKFPTGGSATTLMGLAVYLPNAASQTIASSWRVPVFFDGSTTSAVFFATNVASGYFVKANGSGFFTSGDTMTYEFSYPI